MTDGPQENSSSSLESPGIVDPCLRAEMRLGANLEAQIAPEDPDERQYWLWDVDELPEEDTACRP